MHRMRPERYKIKIGIKVVRRLLEFPHFYFCTLYGDIFLKHSIITSSLGVLTIVRCEIRILLFLECLYTEPEQPSYTSESIDETRATTRNLASLYSIQKVSLFLRNQNKICSIPNRSF